MKSDIMRILHYLETNENIEILYACEAGSHVWGFANEESDCDVRFIYKKANVRDYISLKDDCDVIECEGENIDIVGWDIRKALKLHYNNNPSLWEWLSSNQVYIDKGIHNIFTDLGDFDIDILKNHYLSMALKHWKRYCGLGFQKSKIKKYLHVLRFILTWNLLDMGIYPPLDINELLENEKLNLSFEIKESIHELIDYHQNSSQLREETIFKINNFILNSLNVMKKVKTDSIKDETLYDERFREILLICSNL